MDTTSSQQDNTSDTVQTSSDVSSATGNQKNSGKSIMMRIQRALVAIPSSKSALSGIGAFVGILALCGVLAATGILDVRSLTKFTGIGMQTASVNGVAIDRELLTREMEGLAGRYGLDPESEAYKNAEADIKNAALDNLIVTELLVQAAAARGITATPEAVAQEKKTMTEMLGGEETFKTQLAAAGITEDTLDGYIAKDLAIRALLEQEVPSSDISVTDEAVRALYNTTYENAESAPSFKEAEASLREQLINQELEARYGAFIEELKAQATIER